MSRKLYTCAEGHTSAYGREDWCPDCSMTTLREFGERMRQANAEANAQVGRQKKAMKAHQFSRAHNAGDCLVCRLAISFVTEPQPQTGVAKAEEEPWWEKKNG